MSYETIKGVSAMAGLLIFIALFAGVLVYALWPSNRQRFERAGRIPLNDDLPKDDLPQDDLPKDGLQKDGLQKDDRHDR